MINFLLVTFKKDGIRSLRGQGRPKKKWVFYKMLC